MSEFWCKNVSCTRYETLLLTENDMRNYSGFYQDLSCYYIMFINFIAALTYT